MSKLLKHLHTVHVHRKTVRKWCFKMGIPVQGLLHDLSKYSIAELSIAKYYVGTKSPHQVARETVGFSKSWNHHYHRNKHHFQYWWDEDETGKIIPVKMPYRYVVESFCDMVGAGKAYLKDKWTIHSPLEYYNAKCQDRLMHPESKLLLECLLIELDRSSSVKAFLQSYKFFKKYLKDAYKTSGIHFLEAFKENANGIGSPFVPKGKENTNEKIN